MASASNSTDSATANQQLIGAAQQDSLELFDIAIKRKAQINFQDGVHSTALHYACQCGSPLVLEQLLLKMPENLVYIKNVQGNTPLHCLLDGRHSEEKTMKMMDMLLKHNPLILTRNKDGMTCVDLAQGNLKNILQRYAQANQRKKSKNNSFIDKRDIDVDDNNDD